MVSLPSELKDVKALFSEFEKFLSDLKHQDINKKLRDQNFRKFEKAMDIVKRILRGDPPSDLVETAKHLRNSYVRRLLEELPNIPPLLEEEWFKMWLNLLGMGDDLKFMFESNPALRQAFEDFIRSQDQEFRRQLYDDWLAKISDDREYRRRLAAFLLLEEEEEVV